MAMEPPPPGQPGQQPPMGQPPMGQPPMGQPPMGQPGQPPMGQQPMGQPPMGQHPMGQGPQATSMGMDPKIAAMLSYMFGWVSGLIFFLVEKQHREVRFHAAQSLLFSGALTVIYILLNILAAAVSGFFAIISLLVSLGSLVLWIVLMVKGYGLQHIKLPVIGDIAENMASSQSSSQNPAM